MSRLILDGEEGGSRYGEEGAERSSAFEERVALRVEDASDLDETLSTGNRLPDYEDQEAGSSLTGMLGSAPRQTGRHRRRRVGAGDTDSIMPPVDEVRRENDSPGHWSVIPYTSGTPPRARSLHVSVVVDDSMYVFGGYDGSNRVNDFYKYHFPTKSWLTVSYYSPRPSPRDRHVAVPYRGNIYIFGGYDGSTRVNDFWMFDTQAQSWSTVVQTGPVPSARHSHSAVEYNGSMYVFGGYDGNYRNDFHAFNFISEKWSPVEVSGGSGAGPRARYSNKMSSPGIEPVRVWLSGTSAVVHKDSMLVFGGHDGSKHLNDFYVFDFLTSTWSIVEPSLSSKVPPPTPRDSHIAAVYGDSMYIFGGSTGTARNDLYEFNLVTRGWNELRRTSAAWRSMSSSNNPDSPAGGEDGMAEQGDIRPCPRFCHTGVVYRGALCIFGGYDGQNRLNDFRKFTLGSEVNVEIPESTLLADLRGMVDDPTWSDVVFDVEGKKVYAHKMMCVRCPYFQAMFSPSLNMKESSMSANECIPIQGGVTHTAFKGVLEFLYTDQVHQLTVDSAMDLFMTADQFGIDRLKKICEKEILQSINIDNAPTILQAADMHAANGLRKRCLDFILRNFDAISKTMAFEEMGRQNVELLLEILRMR